jgi:hypothetical protein
VPSPYFPLCKARPWDLPSRSVFCGPRRMVLQSSSVTLSEQVAHIGQRHHQGHRFARRCIKAKRQVEGFAWSEIACTTRCRGSRSHRSGGPRAARSRGTLRGHYGGNISSSQKVYRHVERYWFGMLRSRSWARSQPSSLITALAVSLPKVFSETLRQICRGGK